MAKVRDLAGFGGFGVQPVNCHTRSFAALCGIHNGIHEEDNGETLPESKLNCEPR